jgi:hypothetical protein
MVVGSTTEARRCLWKSCGSASAKGFHPHTAAVVWDIASRDPVWCPVGWTMKVAPHCHPSDRRPDLGGARGRGVVEYWTPEEAAHTLIAIDRESVTPATTAAELHACSARRAGQLHPLPDHNQSPQQLPVGDGQAGDRYVLAASSAAWTRACT